MKTKFDANAELAELLSKVMRELDIQNETYEQHIREKIQMVLTDAFLAGIRWEKERFISSSLILLDK